MPWERTPLAVSARQKAGRKRRFANTNFTTLGLATQENWKNRDTSEWESRTEWHRIVVFGKLGEFAATLKKGAHIKVEGTLRSHERTVELAGNTKNNPKTHVYRTWSILALLYFPARVNFRLHLRGCQTDLNLDLALLSLRNFPHIIHFAWFFVLTAAQFEKKTSFTMMLSGLISLPMDVMVELAEGLTGKGNCRFRDLVPDAAGTLSGAILVSLWETGRKRFALSSRST